MCLGEKRIRCYKSSSPVNCLFKVEHYVGDYRACFCYLYGIFYSDNRVNWETFVSCSRVKFHFLTSLKMSYGLIIFLAERIERTYVLFGLITFLCNVCVIILQPVYIFVYFYPYSAFPVEVNYVFFFLSSAILRL